MTITTMKNDATTTIGTAIAAALTVAGLDDVITARKRNISS